MPFVYFIIEENNAEVFKVGKTSIHPADRCAQLQTGNPRKLIIYRWIEIADHHTAELYLHEKYNGLHIRGEWFYMSIDVVDVECEYIAGKHEDVKISSRYPKWTDEDRINVQEIRQKKGKYKGKKNPRDVANARNEYFNRKFGNASIFSDE
jgi:hypothetical protein